MDCGNPMWDDFAKNSVYVVLLVPAANSFQLQFLHTKCTLLVHPLQLEILHLEHLHVALGCWTTSEKRRQMMYHL
jgi:hypothetical protein